MFVLFCAFFKPLVMRVEISELNVSSVDHLRLLIPGEKIFLGTVFCGDPQFSELNFFCVARPAVFFPGQKNPCGEG